MENKRKCEDERINKTKKGGEPVPANIKTNTMKHTSPALTGLNVKIGKF